MSEPLPGWIETTLGDLLQFNYGKSLPERDRSGVGFPVYGSNGIVGYHDTALTSGETLIIGRKGSVGEVHFSVGPCHPIDTTYYVDKFHEMPAKYWLYYLKYLRLGDLNKATAIPGINRQDAYRTQVKLAPLSEQQRIANKLDRLLARVDACRERCNRIPLILKRFRQSVIDVATTGQLIENNQSVGNSQLVSEWQEAMIGDLVVEKPRNGYSPKPVDFETATRSLTLTATTSGRFNPEYFKYINETIPNNSHLWLEPGDILIQRANTLDYVGVSAIYDGPSGSFIYPDLMMKCRANSKVLPKFLHYLLLSSKVRTYFRSKATGTAGNMPKINQQTVISAPVHVPSIEEQQEIVRQVEALFTFADRLEARYQTARAQVNRLIPALLDKAFRGELVPQDPNDEHASLLLEQIRQSKAENPSLSSRKPRRTMSRNSQIPKTLHEQIYQQFRTRSFDTDELPQLKGWDAETHREELFQLLDRGVISMLEKKGKDGYALKCINKPAEERA